MVESPDAVNGNIQTPSRRDSVSPNSRLDNMSHGGRSRLSSQRTPKIRKVNNYIIFYDDIIGKGQFGTVVKAQLASDLLPDNGSAKKGQQIVRSTVDTDKTIYACKVIDSENFQEAEMQQVFKEVKIHSMIQSDYCIKHFQTIKTSTKIYMIQEYANSFDLAVLLEQRGTLR